MRLTTYADYSFRVLMRLALHSEDLVTIADIARVYGISEHHLMKVVHQLGLAGYIETVRGHGGGLRLARAPHEINVGEVVRRTEPDFGLVACFRKDESCVITRACTLNRVLDEALEAFLAVLDRYTLTDLLEKRASLASLLGVATLRPGKAVGSRLRRTRN